MMQWNFHYEHFNGSIPSRWYFRIDPSEKRTVDAYYFGFEIRMRKHIFFIWIAKQNRR